MAARALLSPASVVGESAVCVEGAVRRLNWGCGPHPAPGWVNSDRIAGAGIESVDVRAGLPWPAGTFDYAVAVHALQDLPYADLVPALDELRRVLRPAGVLRLALPDLDRAIDAYRRGDRGYFYIPDHDVQSLGGKLAVQIAWYGSVRTPFTWDLADEVCRKAGFRHVVRCAFRQTASAHAGIVELDNRERESLFVEAYP